MKKKVVFGLVLVALVYMFYPAVMQQLENYKYMRYADSTYEMVLNSGETEEEARGVTCRWLEDKYWDNDNLIMKYELSEGTRFSRTELRKEIEPLKRESKAIAKAKAKYCD